MAHDAQGNPVTGSAHSVAVLDRAISECFAWKGDPLTPLVEAAQADPAFILGNVAAAVLLLLSGFRGDGPAILERLAAAEAAAAGATPRERRHLRAAQAFARGAMVEAAAVWESILLEHPRDAFALRFASDTYYYLGHSESIRDSVARVLPDWDESDPLFGFVLGRHAFGLEETGWLDKAEATARRALALNPEDAWAAHAMAHVFDTRAEPEEGVRFLEDTHRNWQVGHWLAVHIGWHHAVFLIELGRAAEVLQHYDRFVAPRLEMGYLLDWIDAASLLWRLERDGIRVGERWRPVAAVALKHVDAHMLAFNDLHIALAVAGAGDRAGAERLLASLDHYVVAQQGDNRDTTVEIGRAVIEAILAFGSRDFRRVVDLLLPVRHKFIRIGGSHAQRDIITQTLIAAAFNSGNAKLARALLAERLALRPTPRTRRLFAQAASPIADIATSH